MNVTNRGLTQEYVISVMKLEENIFGKSNKVSIENSLTTPNRQYYIVVDNGEVIAFCEVNLMEIEMEIVNIAVKDCYRGSGVGNSLMNYVFEEHPNVDVVFLEVRFSNQSAINLYIKNGFEEVGVRKGYYSDGEDAIIMKR